MMDEHLQPKQLQQDAAGYWYPKVWEPLPCCEGTKAISLEKKTMRLICFWLPHDIY